MTSSARDVFEGNQLLGAATDVNAAWRFSRKWRYARTVLTKNVRPDERTFQDSIA